MSGCRATPQPIDYNMTEMRRNMVGGGADSSSTAWVWFGGLLSSRGGKASRRARERLDKRELGEGKARVQPVVWHDCAWVPNAPPVAWERRNRQFCVLNHTEHLWTDGTTDLSLGEEEPPQQQLRKMHVFALD